MWLFIAFLAVPLIEITLFIQIGGAIGLGWTLATVVITAVIGTVLVRNQGALALTQLRASFSDMKDPTEPLVHGAMILFSGALLLTPGFFTDAIGFLLLIPGVRTAVFGAIRARVNIQTIGPGPRDGFQETRRAHYQNDVIEGEYSEAGPEDDTPSGPSGWTRH
ncbi:FxsA family protein [Roseobacter ponti]|uniref:FxsA family protein n=1 Tax=Roseobacter ponti TaxID=1891787 RepID=A0A858SPV4_9RHOB|nr:FxsA family protein [Roseobacter ponti]QJF49721.1 FxsA family protein [Roseobacter ponti]